MTKPRIRKTKPDEIENWDKYPWCVEWEGGVYALPTKDAAFMLCQSIARQTMMGHR